MSFILLSPSSLYVRFTRCFLSHCSAPARNATINGSWADRLEIMYGIGFGNRTMVLDTAVLSSTHVAGGKFPNFLIFSNATSMSCNKQLSVCCFNTTGVFSASLSLSASLCAFVPLCLQSAHVAPYESPKQNDRPTQKNILRELVVPGALRSQIPLPTITHCSHSRRTRSHLLQPLRLLSSWLSGFSHSFSFSLFRSCRSLLRRVSVCVFCMLVSLQYKT